jgi:hypothetical protein
VVAALPTAMACVRLLRARWLPIGDNGYFAVRARDVLTEHHPLLGAWSSGSQVVGVDVNNLGPIQLDLLWPFVKVLGLGPGTIVGVTLVNALCAAGVAVVAHRRAGAVGAWLGAATAAALSWTLGTELLVEPRQHHALVLPFLLCLVLAWALADGDIAVLPVAALAATYVAQTHLTFLVPLAAVGVVAVGALVRRRRLARRDHPDDRPAIRGPVITTAVLLVLMWLQTAVEELQGGQGNVSSVWEAARAETAQFGVSGGTRTMASILRPFGGWLPPGFVDFDPNHPELSGGPAAVTLVLVALALVALVVVAVRRRDRTMGSLLLVVGAALASGWYAVITSPSGRFGVLASNFRWLWPISAVVTFTLVLGVLRSGVRRPDARVVVGAATLAVTVALWALPASHQGKGPDDGRPLIEVSRDLLEQMHDFEFDGTVLIDRRGNYFGEPFSYVAIAALQDQSIEFESGLPQDARRFGEKRAYDGSADATLTFLTGVPAEADRPGERRIAFVSWLSDAEREELFGLLEAAETRSLTEEEQARSLLLRHRRAAGTMAVWFSEGTPPDIEPTRGR